MSGPNVASTYGPRFFAVIFPNLKFVGGLLKITHSV